MKPPLHPAPWAAIAILGLIAAACQSPPARQIPKLMEAADRYRQADRLPSAALLYRKVLQIDAQHGPAYFGLGQVLLAQKDPVNAAGVLWRAYEFQRPDSGYDAFRPLVDIYLKFYTAADRRARTLFSELSYLIEQERERNPGSLDALHAEALLALAAEDPESAVTRLREVHRGRPEDARAAVNLCAALVRTGKVAEAESLALEALRVSPRYLPLYDFLYALHGSRRDWKQAGDIRRSAAQAAPGEIKAWIALAAHHHHQGQRFEMRQALDRVLNDSASFPDRYLAVGSFYVQTGQTDAGIRVYQQGIEADEPRTRDYRYGVLQAMILDGRRSDAIRLLGKMIDEDPADSGARLLRASINNHRDDGEEGRKELVIADLVTAVGIDPGSAVLRHALGETYLRFGDLHGAHYQFAEAEQRAPRFLLPKLALANLRLANNEFVKAKELAQEVLEIHPGHRGARLLVADSWIGLREFEVARAELSAILEGRPDDLEALNALARLNLLSRNYRAALETYDGIRRNHPADRRALEGVVGALVALRRVQEARSLLEDEIEESPGDPQLLLAHGLLLRRLGDYAAAAEQFRAVLRAEAGNAPVHTRLGEALLRLGRHAEAEESLQRAVALGSRRAEPYIHLGNLRLAEERRDEAREYLEKALEREPDHLVALNNLAFLLLETQKDLNRALTLAQRARTLDPENLAAADTLGQIYLERGLPAEAVPVFRELSRRVPRRARYRCALARALLETGEREAAWEELDKAMRSQPSPEEIRAISALRHQLGA